MPTPAPTSVTYRAVHFTRELFPYVVLGIVIVEFFAAFACMFTFPPGALILVFLGLITIGLGVAGNGILCYADDAMVERHRVVTRRRAPRP